MLIMSVNKKYLLSIVMIKYYNTIIIFVLCLLCIDTYAQQELPTRKKVGLVLGGGGAKGAAEVGVMKVLEEANIPIDYIAGTSIGGVVGALYSIGYSTQFIDSMFRSQNWIFLLGDEVKRVDKTFLYKKSKETYTFNVPFSLKKGSIPNGYITGQNILNLYTNLTTGYHQVNNFMDLPTPFKCVATDIVYGNQVNISSGSLPVAMRSTMSIPGVFVPMSRDSMLLIDGGALDNFPVDVVRDMGAEIIIGIDLTTGWKTKEELKTLPNMVSQLINIMGERKYHENRYATNLYINPPLKGYGPASFTDSAIDSMITIGEKAARNQWDEIIALKKQIYYDTLYCDTITIKKGKRVCQTSYDINKINIEGIKESDKKWFRNRVNLKENSTITIDQINQAISIMQGVDAFYMVNYYLTDQAPYDLTFVLTPKQYKLLNIGTRIDNINIASLLLNVNNDNNISVNNHYSFSTRISRNPYIHLQYSYGNFYNKRFSVNYTFRYNNFGLFSHNHKMMNFNFISQSFEALYSKTKLNSRYQFGVTVDLMNGRDSLYKPNYQFEKVKYNHSINYFADYLYDGLDSDYFPTKGYKVHVRGMLYTNNGYSYRKGIPYGSIQLSGETAWKILPTLYLLPKISGRFLFGKNFPLYYQNYVGGIFDANFFPQQFGWETSQYVHLLENHYLAARINLRYTIKKRLYATALSEFSKSSHKFEDLIGGKYNWGVGLRVSYDLFLGPLSAQVNYSDLYKNVGFFINAGFYF